MSNKRGAFLGAYATTNTDLWEILDQDLNLYNQIKLIGEYDESCRYFTLDSLCIGEIDQWDINIRPQLKNINPEFIQEQIDLLKDFVTKNMDIEAKYYFGLLNDSEF